MDYIPLCKHWLHCIFVPVIFFPCLLSLQPYHSIVIWVFSRSQAFWYLEKNKKKMQQVQDYVVIFLSPFHKNIRWMIESMFRDYISKHVSEKVGI